MRFPDTRTQLPLDQGSSTGWGTVNIWGQVIFCWGGHPVRCLVAPLTSAHQMPVAPLPGGALAVSPDTAKRPPEGRLVPAWGLRLQVLTWPFPLALRPWGQAFWTAQLCQAPLHFSKNHFKLNCFSWSSSKWSLKQFHLCPHYFSLRYKVVFCYCLFFVFSFWPDKFPFLSLHSSVLGSLTLIVESLFWVMCILGPLSFRQTAF